MGLRDKYFGEPMRNMSAALTTATTAEEKAQIFKSGFIDINNRYNNDAQKGAIVIGTILGGVAGAAAAKTGGVALSRAAKSEALKESNLSGLFNPESSLSGLFNTETNVQGSSINPLYIVLGIGFVLLLFLRK